jgi:hypothetical protein
MKNSQVGLLGRGKSSRAYEFTTQKSYDTHYYSVNGKCKEVVTKGKNLAGVSVSQFEVKGFRRDEQKTKIIGQPWGQNRDLPAIA